MIEGSVQLDCLFVKVCVQEVLLRPPRKWVVPLCWECGGTALCVLMLSRLCCVSGNVCGVPVGFWWSVKFSLRMGILEEWDGVVLGVSWSLPSNLASGHWSTSNEGSSWHTLAAEVIKWATSCMSFMWSLHPPRECTTLSVA